MPPQLTVDILDRMRPDLASLVMERARKLPAMGYCDLRIEVREEKGALAENGSEKASAEDYAFDFGVRAIAGTGASAAGYYGRILGSTDAGNIEAVVWEGIRQAHLRARTGPAMRTCCGWWATASTSGASGTLIPSTASPPETSAVQ